MRKAICKYCGEEFEYPDKGRERVHCRKEECLRKARNEANRKWYANKVNKQLEGEKIRIISKEKKPQVVYSATERADNRLNNEDFSDLIEVARELGTIRFKICEMITKETKRQSFFDRQDQDFLHKLENLDELTDDEAVNMIVEEKRKREARRSHKIRKSILQRLVEGIKPNPNAFVVETLKNRDNFKYKKRVKENETIQ